MLTYLDNSLFESPAQTLVNTVNTVGVMGKGIAAQFKKVYPEMFKEYRTFCDTGKLTIGKLYIYRTPNKQIVNFPTKLHWRQRSKIEFIEKGLKKFNEAYLQFGISSVSFPQLGCGNGELDWESEVRPVMEKYLDRLRIPVYIHLYHTSGNFIPERLDREYAKEVMRERQSISTEKLWQDLMDLINRQKQSSLFDSVINFGDEQINVTNGEHETIILKENLEDLFNQMRIWGTVSGKNLFELTSDIEVTNWLYDSLCKLKYIKPIGVKQKNSESFIRGLGYIPPPAEETSKNSDNLV